jgi:hypothetical protein
MKITKLLAAGVVALLVLVYPVFFGMLAYGVLDIFDVHRKMELALLIGYVSLALLPCYILGDVYFTVKDARKREEEAPLVVTLEKKDLLEVWEKCLDVQMHFNGIELQIRNYAVTLLVAVIGAAAYALKEHLDVKLFGHNFSMALAILPAGILGWYAFYFMDRHWYHRLLLGSVFHTIKIEKAVGPELQLGVAIGEASPIPIFGKKMHSTQKIDLFYAAGLTFLIVLTGFVLLQGALFAPDLAPSNPPATTLKTPVAPSAPPPQDAPRPPEKTAQPNQGPDQKQNPQ